MRQYESKDTTDGIHYHFSGSNNYSSNNSYIIDKNCCNNLR